MAECVWIRKGDEHLPHCTNGIWDVLGEAVTHDRIWEFRENKTDCEMWLGTIYAYNVEG